MAGAMTVDGSNAQHHCFLDITSVRIVAAQFLPHLENISQSYSLKASYCTYCLSCESVRPSEAASYRDGRAYNPLESGALRS